MELIYILTLVGLGAFYIVSLFSFEFLQKVPIIKYVFNNIIILKLSYILYVITGYISTYSFIIIWFTQGYKTVAMILLAILALWYVYTLVDDIFIPIKHKSSIRRKWQDMEYIHLFINFVDTILLCMITFYLSSELYLLTGNALIMNVYAGLISGFLAMITVGISLKYFFKKQTSYPIFKHFSESKTTPNYDIEIKASHFKDLVNIASFVMKRKNLFKIKDFYLRLDLANMHITRLMINKRNYFTEIPIYIEEDKIVKFNFKGIKLYSNTNKLEFFIIGQNIEGAQVKYEIITKLNHISNIGVHPIYTFETVGCVLK